MSTAAKTLENVWNYPRPPALEKTAKRLRVLYKGEDGSETVLADTTNGYRVLETSHPPSYYIPPEDVKVDLLSKNAKQSFCEWKGVATYFDFKPAEGGSNIKSRIWAYSTPSTRFKPITDHFAFYASPFTCFVDEEEVIPQPGDFYGSWMTSDIDGGPRGVKGGPGTWGW